MAKSQFKRIKHKEPKDPKQVSRTRRRILLGTAVAAPVIGLGIARPGDHGGNHNPYFLRLQQALKDAELYHPTLVIDKQLLQQNIDQLKFTLAPNKNYRIVAKSLPSLDLLAEVMSRAKTNSLMLFNQPFLNQVAQRFPEADVLMGKPLPVAEVAKFYEQHKGKKFKPAKQVQWLVDTIERLTAYQQLLADKKLAKKIGKMRINLEIDVGLHRGGFTNIEDSSKALEQIKADPNLEFAGFMGYEPHIVKVPEILGDVKDNRAEVLRIYETHLSEARVVFGEDLNEAALTLNTGGSHTYELYGEYELPNDISAGSVLVKPTDFDTELLKDFQHASFIATPVLKATGETKVPGIEFASGVLNWYDRNAARAYFIYGGHWPADYVSPPGLQSNSTYGYSSNQEMVNASEKVKLKVNDFVFLRPHQSESVFLQFGDIAVYDNGKITERWPVLQQN